MTIPFWHEGYKLSVKCQNCLVIHGRIWIYMYLDLDYTELFRFICHLTFNESSDCSTDCHIRLNIAVLICQWIEWVHIIRNQRTKTCRSVLGTVKVTMIWKTDIDLEGFVRLCSLENSWTRDLNTRIRIEFILDNKNFKRICWECQDECYLSSILRLSYPYHVRINFIQD